MIPHMITYTMLENEYIENDTISKIDVNFYVNVAVFECSEQMSDSLENS